MKRYWNKFLNWLIPNRRRKILTKMIKESEKLKLYDEVFNITNFLNEDVSFRERLFYIQNGWDGPQLCSFCKKNKLPFFKNKLKLAPTCSGATCRKKHRSNLSIEANKNLSPEARKIKSEKSRKANLGSYEERYGKEKAETLKEQQRMRMLGNVQSPETIEKRSRKHRGKKLSNETKLKISQSNKKTHNSPEYRKKAEITHKNMGKKISNTLKNKIASGEFTPTITNSWTRRQVEVELGEIKFKFRSSWEAAFFVLNPTFVYEKIRIPYNYKGKFRNYIVDFADYNTNTLYEIKPNSLLTTPICIAKEAAAKMWATQNGWTYKIITDDWFIDNLTRLEEIKFPYISLLNKGLSNARKVL
jgi:hypothetical protein